MVVETVTAGCARWVELGHHAFTQDQDLVFLWLVRGLAGGRVIR